MTLQEISKFNLNIDMTYKELIKASDLNIQENCQAYYKRSDNFVRHILKEYPEGRHFFLKGDSVRSQTIETWTNNWPSTIEAMFVSQKTFSL